MPIRNVFVDMWAALTATGLAVLALTLVIAPFVISLIANIGRQVPGAARRLEARPRAARAIRTLPL